MTSNPIDTYLEEFFTDSEGNEIEKHEDYSFFIDISLDYEEELKALNYSEPQDYEKEEDLESLQICLPVPQNIEEKYQGLEFERKALEVLKIDSNWVTSYDLLADEED